MAYPQELGLRSEDAVLAFDSRLVAVGWNAAAERLTGLAPTDVLGRYCWEALRGVDLDGHLVCHPGCSLARACTEGGAVSTTMLAIRSLGGRRTVSLSTVSLVCGGEQLNLHVFSDVKAGPAAGLRSAVEAPAPITRRQQEVLTLLAEGLSTDEIATSLTVSRATVRNHVRALMGTLECHSRLEAVARGRALGLIL